jgi:hypothetical protein
MSDCTNCKNGCDGTPDSFVLSEFSESNTSQAVEVMPGECVIVRAYRVRDTIIKAQIFENVCGTELVEQLYSCGSQVEIGAHTGNEISLCKPGRYRFQAFEADGTTPVEIGLTMPVLVKTASKQSGCGCGC